MAKLKQQVKVEVQPAFMGIRDAATYTSLSAQTISKHIKDGKLKATRVGGRVLIAINALSELLKTG